MPPSRAAISREPSQDDPCPPRARSLLLLASALVVLGGCLGRRLAHFEQRRDGFRVTSAISTEANWQGAIQQLQTVLGETGFTASDVELLTTNLKSAKGSSAELSRYKRALLLSDTANFSRPIQTMAGSHLGLRYIMHVHDPTLCVWISRLIYSRGWWEQDISRNMLKLLSTKFMTHSGQKKRIFLDIGANIGWYTFLWAAHGVDVISVEGMQYNVNVQQKTLHANPQLQRHVRAYHRLLGSDTQGKVCIKFHETEGLPNRGNGQIVPDDGKQFECQQITAFQDLNAFDPRHEHIYAMKIDIEGFEVHALEGMGLDGDNLPCFIWIEIVSAGSKAGFTELRGKAGTVRDWLQMKGYEINDKLKAGGVSDFVFSRKAAMCN
jgi:FkbM family methyltransferase